ncbi:hypothetical protein DZK25_03740 [Wenzhouxiangella sp. 15181]|nr:hypothetical protein DZK25_03740 [Wenzhouxiangella sp. 15181]RFP67886.1 hypothetical protein DZK26_10515 [Wenzhouxiangella sp. 15190]
MTPKSIHIRASPATIQYQRGVVVIMTLLQSSRPRLILLLEDPPNFDYIAESSRAKTPPFDGRFLRGDIDQHGKRLADAVM